MAEKLKLTDLKRKAIIKAATSEFHRNGYEATSMDRISKTANVSKRTVYNHFSNKQALFDAILDKLLHIVFKKELPAYDANLPLKEQLYKILCQEVNLFVSEELMSLARVVTSELIRTPSTANTFWEDIHRKKTATFFWMQDAIDDERLSIKSIEVATRQLGGMIKEFVFWPHLLGGQKTPSKSEIDEIINSTIDVFLTYYEVKK
jgi:TetR/AcrR family transcriptional regulator, regulator of autoinduction and epiphytic fitness